MLAKVIVTIFIIILILFFVVTNISTPQKMVERNEIIKEYVAQHPDTNLTVSLYSIEMFNKEKDFWITNCTNPFLIDRNYYLATAIDSNWTLRALFEKSQMDFICGVIQDTTTSQIILTKDSPTPPQKTCSSVGGIKCDLNQKCAGNWITVTDTTRCCDNLCKTALTPEIEKPPVIQKAICEDANVIECKSNQKCISIVSDRNVTCGCAKCALKICKDYGGMICPTDTNCYGNLASTSDTNKCCLGVCYKLEVTYQDTNDINAS